MNKSMRACVGLHVCAHIHVNTHAHGSIILWIHVYRRKRPHKQCVRPTSAALRGRLSPVPSLRPGPGRPSCVTRVCLTGVLSVHSTSTPGHPTGPAHLSEMPLGSGTSAPEPQRPLSPGTSHMPVATTMPLLALLQPLTCRPLPTHGTLPALL